MYWMERADRTRPLELRPGVPPAFSQKEPIDFREYWRPIRDHHRLMMAMFLVAELVTLVLLLTRTPTYTSASTILIERQAPEVLESQRPNDEAQSSAETFYATQYEMLRSRSLAARVIRDLGLEHDPAFTGAGAKPT